MESKWSPLSGDAMTLNYVHRRGMQIRRPISASRITLDTHWKSLKLFAMDNQDVKSMLQKLISRFLCVREFPSIYKLYMTVGQWAVLGRDDTVIIIYSLQLIDKFLRNWIGTSYRVRFSKMAVNHFKPISSTVSFKSVTTFSKLICSPCSRWLFCLFKINYKEKLEILLRNGRNIDDSKQNSVIIIQTYCFAVAL